MDDGPRACRFCSREFHDSNVWIQHYNSRHSTIYRPAINRYRTCSRCFKFVTDEDVPTHRCRRLVPNSRSAANSSPGDASLPFDDPTSISVSLDEYLIHPVVVPDAPPTASSTRRATSIEEAPSARRSGSSSATFTEDPRGDLHETAEAVHDPPCQQPGDSEGPRPSKPAAADDPATQGHSRRRLRSANATAATAVPASAASAATVERGHSSRRTAAESSRADPQAESANRGVQSPATLRGVPASIRRGVSGPFTRGVSGPTSRGGSGPHSHGVSPPSSRRVSRLPQTPQPHDIDSENYSPLRTQADSGDERSNSDDPDSNTPCIHPQCNKTFKNQRDMIKHVNYTHHDGFLLPHRFSRCNLCNKVYTSDGIRNHQRIKHRVQSSQNSTPVNDAQHADPVLLPAINHQEEISLDALHQFYRKELYWINSHWKPLLHTIHLNLLDHINSRDPIVSDQSLSAYLVLPGFIEAVRMANRLPGAKQLKIDTPITYLRLFNAIENKDTIEQVILSTSKALLRRIESSLIRSNFPSGDQRSRLARKVTALVKIGRISKATNLVDSLDSPLNHHISREEAQNLIPDLFPAANALDELGERDDNELEWRDVVQITTEDIIQAFSTLSIDRASGFSGWSNRLLKHLFFYADSNGRQTIADSYASLFNRILKGSISTHMRTYITNVRLCLLPKPGDIGITKYRPIGIGETLFRFLGRVIHNKIGKEVGKQLAPLQLAVGISGGVEIAATIAGLLPAINDSQPPEDSYFATMSIDIKNAFNSLRRSFILQGLRRYCKGLIPLFMTVYNQQVNLRWSDGSIIGQASTGVFQGDPLSSLYFAVGIQQLLFRLQRKLREIETESNLSIYARRGILFAIADDITIHARTQDLFALTTSLPDIFTQYELPLNVNKSWILGPHVFSHHQADDIGLPRRLPRDGGKILGVPIGDSAFCIDWVGEHFTHNAPPIRTLGLLPARTAITLLKYSYNTRMHYLRKTLPERIIATSIFSRFDDLINEALLNTGVIDCRDQLIKLRCLPSDKGGLGMPSLEGHHGRRHHLITAMRTREFLKVHYPHFVGDHTAAYNSHDVDINGTPPEEIADTMYQLRENNFDDDALKLFGTALRRWTDYEDSTAAHGFHSELVTSGALGSAATFLSVQGVKLSFTTYSNGSRSNYETLLTDKEYVEAMRHFMLAPFRRNLDGLILCRCRPNDPWDLHSTPYHSSNCQLNSRERTFRHSAVCQLLVKLLRKASPSARITLEPRDATARRHPDILIEDNAMSYHVDVSIVEPTSVHALSDAIGAATNKGAAAAMQETKKISSYANTSWPDTLPFVLESTGRLGTSAEHLLEKITSEKNHLRSWFNGEISLLMAKYQGRMRIHTHALIT